MRVEYHRHGRYLHEGRGSPYQQTDTHHHSVQGAKGPVRLVAQDPRTHKKLEEAGILVTDETIHSYYTSMG